MLISEITKVNPNTIVVLANGAVEAMPWVDEVSGILESYLGGKAAGGAIADILFGEINPSGKLAETFPVNLRQTPAYLNYPGYQDDCYYREGMFVGYRYYITKDIKPLFTFGYGLSYITFEYSDIYIDKPVIREDETVIISITVKNTGDMAGKEIVQLYMHDNISEIPRPEIELKHFSKISIQPGEAKKVSFTLGFRDFAYFDVDLNRFAVESGTFTVFISGENLPLQTEIEVRLLREKKENLYTIFYIRTVR